MFDDRAQILLPQRSDLPSATRRYKARIPNEARHTVSGSIKSVAATGWPNLNWMWLVPVLLVFTVSRTDAASDVGIVRMSDPWTFLSSFDCQSKQRIQLPLCSITSQTGHSKGFRGLNLHGFLWLLSVCLPVRGAPYAGVNGREHPTCRGSSSEALALHKRMQSMEHWSPACPENKLHASWSWSWPL